MRGEPCACRRQGLKASGIVYALSRDDSEVVATYLRVPSRTPPSSLASQHAHVPASQGGSCFSTKWLAAKLPGCCFLLAAHA